MRLKEFIDKNGNKVNLKSTGGAPKSSSGTSSGGFKKRFEKLLGYAKNHKDPSVTKVDIKSISEDGFFYSEKRKGKFYFYDIDVTVYIGVTTEAWRLKVYKNDNLEDDLAGQGYVELLKTLRNYITVPVTGTPEYKDLIFEDSKETFLKEFVDAKGNKVNLKKTSTSSKPVSNIPDQTHRFERLVAQIKADKLCDIRVRGITDSVLAFTTDKSVTIRLERKASSHPYILQIGNHVDAYTDYDEVLEILIDEGIIANTDLCESVSFAEDFQVYENLWD